MDILAWEAWTRRIPKPSVVRKDIGLGMTSLIVQSALIYPLIYINEYVLYAA